MPGITYPSQLFPQNGADIPIVDANRLFGGIHIVPSFAALTDLTITQNVRSGSMVALVFADETQGSLTTMYGLGGDLTTWTQLTAPGAAAPTYSGVVNPNGVVSAPVGALYLDVNQPTSPFLWFKGGGGAGNTGWSKDFNTSGDFVANRLAGGTLFASSLGTSFNVTNGNGIGGGFTDQEWEISDQSPGVVVGGLFARLIWDGVTPLLTPRTRRFGLDYIGDPARTEVIFYDVPIGTPDLQFINDLDPTGDTISMVPGEIAWVTTDQTNIFKIGSNQPNTVSTCANLASASYSRLTAGAEFYVRSLDAKFRWFPGPDTSGVELGNAFTGPFGRFENITSSGSWVRERSPSSRAIYQTTWFIDPVSGSDEASGLDQLHPIKTNTELGWRTCGQFSASGSLTTLNYMGSAPISDRLPTVMVASGSGQTIYVKGIESPITIFSGTVSGRTFSDPPTNIPPSVDLSVDQGDPGLEGGEVIKVAFYTGSTLTCTGFLLREVTPGNPSTHIIASWDESGYFTLPSPGDTFVALGISSGSVYAGFIDVQAIGSTSDMSVFYQSCHVFGLNHNQQVTKCWVEGNAVGTCGTDRSLVALNVTDANASIFESVISQTDIQLRNSKVTFNQVLVVDGGVDVGDKSSLTVNGNLGIFSNFTTQPVVEIREGCDYISGLITLSTPTPDPMNYGQSIFGISSTPYVFKLYKNASMTIRDFTPTATTTGGSAIADFNMAPGDQIAPLVAGVPTAPQLTCNTWSTWAAAPFNRVAFDLVSGSSIRG